MPIEKILFQNVKLLTKFENRNENSIPQKCLSAKCLKWNPAVISKKILVIYPSVTYPCLRKKQTLHRDIKTRKSKNMRSNQIQ